MDPQTGKATKKPEDSEGMQRTAPPPESSYRSIFHTWFPLGVERLLQSVDTPIYLAVVMHMADPKIEVGALFSYQVPILMLVSAPTMTLATLANVFAVHARNILKIRLFAFLIGMIGTLIIALIGFTSFGDVILRSALGIPEDEYQAAIEAIRIATPYPLLQSFRQLCCGVLIRNGHSWKVLAARVMRNVGTLTLFGIGITYQVLPGASMGAAALNLGLVIPVIYLFIVSVRVRKSLERTPISKSPATTREITRMGLPLVVTPIIIAITPLIMSAALGRLPGVIVSLATWPIVMSVSGISMGVGDGMDQTTIVHAVDAAAKRRIWHIYISLAIGLMAINALMITSGAYRWVFESIEALSPDTATVTDNVMWLLTPWFFTHAISGCYWSLLARMQMSIPYLVSASVKLVIMVALFALALRYDPVTGVYIAALATGLGSLVGMFWYRWCYDRVCRRQLASSPREGQGDPSSRGPATTG